jgi:hypothetical protein
LPQRHRRSAAAPGCEGDVVPSSADDPDRTATLPALDGEGAAAPAAAAPSAPDDARPAGGATPPSRTEAELAEQLRDSAALCARYLEQLQSREWKRGLADERLRSLEEELDAARRRAQALEGERGALLGTLASLRAECAALRSAAVPPPATAAARASGDSGAWRAASAAREAEIDAERSARLAAERASRATEIKAAEQAARIVELESFGISLGRALQAQTEAAHRAGASAAEAGRAAAELRASLAQLEREVRDGAARGAAGHEAGEGRVQRLTLELERTRGALEERDLQIRRLARNLSRRHAEAPDAAAAAPAAPAAPRGALLQPLNGAAAIALAGRTRTRIGRAPDNEVCLVDSSVSRHHAVLVCTPTGTFIEDLNSVNGVGVNGRRVRQARLAEGDIITLGALRLRFAFGARSAAGG